MVDRHLSTGLDLESPWKHTPGLSMRMPPDWVNQGGKTHSNCGWHHSMGVGMPE